ncbi:elongation factor 1-beta [Octopus bimaculoides]|uniref:Elongation factor 1-beta n=1 Tax=Octopus bimaculoides TaxID=37653 RepID=A0A0L8IEZ4_OCTBM|nr:elongation factor 1-beta [Octopus bimaculoides]|eukprot:XP_014770941.1 PREDICTED: elongation factor 1-beta-like [Octopus bimaculoides]
MGFGDLKTDAGLKSLNEYMSTRSYVEGYEPSQADSVVFGGLSTSPPANYCHAKRWFEHIKSFKTQIAKFPGVKKTLDSYGTATTASKCKPADDSDDDDDDDDDLDLFGSDEDDEERQKEHKKRIEEYNLKKSKKPAIIAKSNIILDVKPWDDETDMAKLEESVRSVSCDGLLWGASKFVAVGYGIRKLQITCVVEDDKVGTDYLEEEITKFEDFVQSVDIVAFNKI